MPSFDPPSIKPDAAPDFTDQSELLATGVARGGVEGRVHFSNKIIASLYETFGTRPAGVVAGDFGPKQTIRGAALQTEPNDKWDLRLVGFRVHDEPGVNSAGGIGKAFGLFAKYVFDPKLTAIFEGSRGGFEPNLLSGVKKREGSALRLDFSGGAARSATYSICGERKRTTSIRRTAASRPAAFPTAPAAMCRSRKSSAAPRSPYNCERCATATPPVRCCREIGRTAGHWRSRRPSARTRRSR